MELSKSTLLLSLQYKGTFNILDLMGYVPIKYNELKLRLKEQISARTLDHRLSDLVEVGLLARTTIFYGQNQLLKEYELTTQGILVKALLNGIALQDRNTIAITLKSVSKTTPLSQIPQTTQIEKSILQKTLTDVSRIYRIYQKFNWKETWNSLKRICKRNGEIMTLSAHPQKNVIIDVSDMGIEVETTKGKRLVETGKIKQAYSWLLKDGKLDRDDHKKASYRSSFICALLSKLEWVDYQKKPKITIFLKENSTNSIRI
ncbi:MAG: hypothetical protein JW776_16795 [Candidatus Lokiarchaeota archaeon]|nr:hypothetical protein [Candidatus Lokiarchaeota archaeon]